MSKEYEEYIRRCIEAVYINNLDIIDFDENVEKIFSLVTIWEFNMYYDGTHAFEIIYNLDRPIGVNPIEFKTLTKVGNKWIQFADTKNSKRILHDTQILAFMNMSEFIKTNREEKLSDILNEKNNSI